MDFSHGWFSGHRHSQGFNISMARQYIFTGPPYSFGSNGSRAVDDYVGSNKIEYTIFNPLYFLGPQGRAGGSASKILLLGHKALTEDSLVSFFGEGQSYVPLLYLNALPLGAGAQTISLDLGLSTATQIFETSYYSYGGGGYVGLKNKGESAVCIAFTGICTKIHEGEQTWKTENGSVETRTKKYRDGTITEVKSSGLVLSTPAGVGGEEGDMVLLIGIVAKFITAVAVPFNETNCMIQELSSVVWEQEVESLLFYSRKDCQDEYEKLQKTIWDSQLVLDDTLASAEDKNDAQKPD
ncbi:hypothetical protein ACA910_010273 [Epithemia clementina (nom. ined.)]